MIKELIETYDELEEVLRKELQKIVDVLSQEADFFLYLRELAKLMVVPKCQNLSAEQFLNAISPIL